MKIFAHNESVPTLKIVDVYPGNDGVYFRMTMPISNDGFSTLEQKLQDSGILLPFLPWEHITGNYYTSSYSFGPFKTKAEAHAAIHYLLVALTSLYQIEKEALKDFVEFLGEYSLK